MKELLSQEEYQSVADSLDLPTGAFIGGRFTSAGNGALFDTINPATGEKLARIAACGPDDVNRATRKAREVFDQGTWSCLHPAERKQALVKLAKLVKRNRRELATMESLESGKPIRECVLSDLPETVNCLLWYAEATDKMYGQTAPAGENAVGLVVREPIGVVACVLPWNFPLMTMAWKIGPALAAGNSVIVKPAEQTSMSALRLAELSLEAGIPGGVLNVVPGLGEEAGRAIGLHPEIDAVSFTGSTEVGRKFLEYSAQSNLKRITLECGGKSPLVVLQDAKNLDHVAEHAVTGAFWNMGENCTANSRLIVDRKIKGDLLKRMLSKLRDWRTGNPLDPANSLGALISPEHSDMIMEHVNGAVKDGAKLICGGKLERTAGAGGYLEPTIFDNVTPAMKIANEEVFGPVLAVLEVGGDAEALQLANSSTYGLQASVFTSDLRRAHVAARKLRAGTISVNCYSEGDITTPFGGYKRSGFGGRDNSLLAFDQYTEVKTIWLDTGDSQIYSQLDDEEKTGESEKSV